VRAVRYFVTPTTDTTDTTDLFCCGSLLSLRYVCSQHYQPVTAAITVGGVDGVGQSNPLNVVV